MRGKKLLAAFLLGVGLCFVPVLGYGEVNQKLKGHMLNVESKTPLIGLWLLRSMVTYMMYNPTRFLAVESFYDPDGSFEKVYKFPRDVNTADKICMMVSDNRQVFTHKSRQKLLAEFKRALEAIYGFIDIIATDMDADVVAIFCGEEINYKEINYLGYFYQGEYHLWGE